MKREHIIMLLVMVFVLAAVNVAFAGTGGSEVQAWWTEITSGVKGFWGKIIAVFFIGSAIVAFKEGGVLIGLFLFLLAILVGTVPDIVDARYTLLF